MIRACLFDFDGTLVDSMPHWSQKMLNILIHCGVDYPSDIIKRITPLGDLGTAKYFREELGVPLSIDEMIAMMDAYALPRYRDEIIAKPGVIAYLQRLRAAGYSLNVLTASPHKMLDPCLKRIGIYDMFDNVWSCDDFATTKSDPAIYVRAAEQIGVGVGEVAFYDDNIGALRTAAAAGMYTVGVYDPTAEDFTAQMKALADRYVYSFDELDTI